MNTTPKNDRYFESIARVALLANGWTVHTSDIDEPYDILATDPLNRNHYRIQVRNIKKVVSLERTVEFTLNARKNNADIYMNTEIDYFIGIFEEGIDSIVVRVFMFENRELPEYSSNKTPPAGRWLKLPITLGRDVLAK